MKLKNVVVIVMLLLMSIISLPQVVRAWGPATILKGIELLGKLIPDTGKEKESKKIFAALKGIIKQHSERGVNVTFDSFYQEIILNKESKVLTYKGIMNSKEVIFSLAFVKGDYKGHIWCDNHEEYKNISKQQFRDYFLKYANVDLGPISPRPGDTAETVLAEFGKPDDTIPLYYEEGIVVSEMLIYHESPKKFLAVDIARGKVIRTQEFALGEGQGLKDALAAAGITPATAPEPTPTPRPTTQTFGPIPTTGFMPR